MNKELEFFAELNRLLNATSSSIRSADPLALVQASEELGHLVSQWNGSEMRSNESTQLSAKISKLEFSIVQLKIQNLQLLQQKAQIEKQIKVLIPGWVGGVYKSAPSHFGTSLTTTTSVRA